MDMQAQDQHFSSATNEQRFSFTGTGAEYFRIWIVNLFLNILTLGIFSAWAKVRRLQYFYRNTHIGDSSFDYHGTPIAILKGRLIGFGLFAIYTAMLQLMPLVGIAILLAIFVAMPFFLVLSFRFRLYNTSFRGLRFGFAGTVKQAYVAFLALPFATPFTGYMLAPFAHHYIKAYQHNNSRYGQTSFNFKECVSNFYIFYLFAMLQYMAVIVLAIVAVVALFWKKLAHLGDIANSPDAAAAFGFIFLGIYLLALLSSVVIIPYFMSRIQNLIWNNTRLGEHRFRSTMSARGLAWIIFSNFVLTVLTLGLYKPFAAIRLARFRIENMTLIPAGSIDEFVASEQQKAGATGMETAEVFDVDVGF